jgi:hypothetical protein
MRVCGGDNNRLRIEHRVRMGQQVERVVYKDVPVPVQMSNERVIVKEVPMPYLECCFRSFCWEGHLKHIQDMHSLTVVCRVQMDIGM